MARVEERFRLLEVGEAADPRGLERDIAQGLKSRPPWLPCRYLYDADGSALFEEICTLPEYYPTRAEEEILRERAGEIAGMLPAGVALVELGSGSASKTRHLLRALLERQGRLRYVPVDISVSILEESSAALLAEHPGLEILAVAGDYHASLRRIEELAPPPRLVLWLGSNVGNFHRREAAAFLGKLAETLDATDRFLVGVDLRKDPLVLRAAYDDARGVTARFNLNLLARINRELGGGFDLSAFRHEAVWNEEEGRMELGLVSTRKQRVEVRDLDLVLDLAKGERIHTENSYKYSAAEIEELAAAAGLRVEARWMDRQGLFSESLMAPVNGKNEQVRP